MLIYNSFKPKIKEEFMMLLSALLYFYFSCCNHSCPGWQQQQCVGALHHHNFQNCAVTYMDGSILAHTVEVMPVNQCSAQHSELAGPCQPNSRNRSHCKVHRSGIWHVGGAVNHSLYSSITAGLPSGCSSGGQDQEMGNLQCHHELCAERIHCRSAHATSGIQSCVALHFHWPVLFLRWQNERSACSQTLCLLT